MFRAAFCTCERRHNFNAFQFLLPSFLMRERGAVLFPALLRPRRNLHHDMRVDNATLLLRILVRRATLLAKTLHPTGLVLLLRRNMHHLLLSLRYVKVVAERCCIPHRRLLDSARNLPLDIPHRR